MKKYERNSKLNIILNRISIASYAILIIFSLAGYLFLYMDFIFLMTAILISFGLLKKSRESIEMTFVICIIAILANILRILFTFPEYQAPGGKFLPYYELVNYLWSVIIMTYIGIIMINSYYMNKENYTLFSLAINFGQLVFLKILALNLLLYFTPQVENNNEYINPSQLIILLIILSGIGILILYIANKKVHWFIFLGIILGIGILVLNIWFFIPILPNMNYLYDFGPTGFIYIEICSFVSICWILITISLLFFVFVENWNDIIKIVKLKDQVIEKQEDSKIND